jgi:hypothetical protein
VPRPHYAPLPTDHAQYRPNEAAYRPGYVEHTGDAGNMPYHENDVQAGQYIIKAPDQKVKRKSKKIAPPPAQDHQYTPGYGDGFYNTHHQQYNNINTGQAGYDAYPYEEAGDQTTGTTGGYGHAYGVNPENNYAYGYGQGAELIGTDQHRQHGGVHHHQYEANSEAFYGDASAYGIIKQPSDYKSYGAELGHGDYGQQRGIGEGNGVVAEQKKKKKIKEKKQPKDDGVSSHGELQQVDGNAYSERTQYNQQSSDAATLFSYASEQGYGDSQQVGVEEWGNGVVAAAAAPEPHNAAQRKIKIKNKNSKPRDESTSTSQDAFDGSRSCQQEGSHHGRGHHDRSNAPPRLDPLAEHIRKTSGPKPSYQDVSMVVFDPLDQSTSLVNPGRLTNESHVTGPHSRIPNPAPKPTKTQNGNSTTNSTKNMGKDDQRVFRDPLDEYLKQNQGKFSELPDESMVVFDPQDQSVVDLPGTYNHHPSGPPNYNQLPAGQHNSNRRPRRVMSQQPTRREQPHQNMIIQQQPQAVWGSPPHHHHQYQPVDDIGQGGHQSVAVQAGQPNEKVMKCIHTVAVPCARIATRIVVRQCTNGSCCCTIL